MLRLMGPSVVSQSVLQVNLLVNQFFASFLAAGYVTYLYYGNRLMQLPFGVLGVSIATVSFPLLAKLAAKGERARFSNALNRALAAGLFLMVPCTVGIWIVAEPACRLAFEYGKFTPEATKAAAQATALYALGLVAYTGVKVLLPAYYAKGRTRDPLWGSLLAMGVNMGLNLGAFLFIEDTHMRFWGLALASGLGAFVNLGWLLAGARKVGIELDGALLGKETGRILAASAVMGLGAWAALKAVGALGLPWERLWDFFVPVLVGAWLYFWTTGLLGCEGRKWVMGNWSARRPQRKAK
jgi:putative peptidoglycan lipid II flippase